jgi:L-serine dehydratase
MNHAIDVGLTKTENLPGKINFPRNAKKVYGDAVKQKDIELKLAAYAYAGGESNASGEIICICPTAGSFATLPAVLRYSKEKYKLTDKKIIEMLAVAGIIGEIVKTNGSVAGAEAGCCAEVGTGCSMAAAAFAYMLGLSNEQIANAASFAMTHHIGLTCDPVLGLVQFPCIERNVAAANRAITAGRLAKNIGQNLFSFDEVVETMTVAGRALQSGYRETSTAGFAKTYLEKNKKNKGFGLSPKEGAGT